MNKGSKKEEKQIRILTFYAIKFVSPFLKVNTFASRYNRDSFPCSLCHLEH